MCRHPGRDLGRLNRRGEGKWRQICVFGWRSWLARGALLEDDASLVVGAHAEDGIADRLLELEGVESGDAGVVDNNTGSHSVGGEVIFRFFGGESD